ncbi:MAG: hypothetical protein IT193_05735 [Propionibacteriaceae bacterium]|nr:hypothetical protein [Propionibacteriaceae bacterium]
MNDFSAAESARLRAVFEAQARAEVAAAVAIAEIAEAHAWTADAPFDVIGTRPVRIGADGTALVDEFLPLEVATAKGISVASATWLIRDVVNLKVRHPLLWFQATKGLVPMWRACQLAAEVARFDLTIEQAQALDERLAPKVPTLPWRRVLQLARGLVAEIAAAKVAALQERERPGSCESSRPTTPASPTSPPGSTLRTRSSSTPWSTGSPTSSASAATPIPRTFGGPGRSACSPPRPGPS